MCTPEGAIAQAVIKNTHLQTRPVLSHKENDNFNINLHLFLISITSYIHVYNFKPFTVYNCVFQRNEVKGLTREPAIQALVGYKPLLYSHPPGY